MAKKISPKWKNLKEVKVEAPKDINNIIIKANNLFIERHQSSWQFYEELENIGS